MPELKDLFETEVLGLTIYGEARGEPVEGQIAVGSVIRNRVTERKSNYKIVCWEPLQFSCWNEDNPNRDVLVNLAQLMLDHMPLKDEVIRQCMWLSFGLTNGSILDNTGEAQNYLTTKLYDEGVILWAKNMTVSKVIGNQTFLI